MTELQLYDTTLRDGAQQEGISLSVEDKLHITQRLDQLGVHFIEGGWPGSNPKEVEYFQRVQGLTLSHAQLAAFGSTRRAGSRAEDDPNIQALLAVQTPVVTLVGKGWDLHVTRVIETTLEENLAMIQDSVAYLRQHGRRVFFDAEHFFDGFRTNPAYALQVVRAAQEAGTECVVLCDTNGGTLPHQVREIVHQVRQETGATLGIHAHSDAEVAVANSLAAIEAGVVQVQGTVNGYGERCGNANLLSIIGNLKLKMGIECITDEQLAKLQETSLFVSQAVNLPSDGSQPYVGASAFAHKGGLHGAAVVKLAESYQHIDPALVGNTKHVLVSELAGRGSINYKLQELGLDMAVPQDSATRLVAQIKELESQGFQFEGADASFELLVLRSLAEYQAPFELVDFLVMVEKRRRAPQAQQNGADLLSEATVKVRVGETVLHTAAEGNGPVNALDQALRKALLQFFPGLEVVQLIDYKVRVVNSAGTGAVVRVLIESSDGEHQWQTVGASTNIIEASWMALVDSLEYWLLRYGRGG